MTVTALALCVLDGRRVTATVAGMVRSDAVHPITSAKRGNWADSGSLDCLTPAGPHRGTAVQVR
jgi:hypothetical protein